jgi:hypothetical protein
MNLHKTSTKKLEQIAKDIQSREILILSTFNVLQGHFIKNDVFMVAGYVVMNIHTNILCLDYFETEDEAWKSILSYNH